MRNVAVYVRVSTKQQDARSQIPDLQRYTANETASVVWYRDHYTGTTLDRPGWRRLQAAVDRGEIGSIVCWRLDRLGRTAKGLTALFDDLQRRSINLISLREGIDLSTPAGRLMANVIASVAQYETEVRAERILAGQAAARAAGKRWGGSVKGRRITVTPEQVALVRQMDSDGATKAAIARTSGLSRPTVYRLVRESASANRSSIAAPDALQTRIRASLL